MPKPILKPPLAMNSPGRVGWAPAWARATGRAAGCRPSARSPVRREARGRRAGAGDDLVELFIRCDRIVPIPFRGGADGNCPVGMGHDVQTVCIELRHPAQVALQHGGLSLHARADDPAPAVPFNSRSPAKPVAWMTAASSGGTGDHRHAPWPQRRDQHAAMAPRGCSRAVSVSKTTRPVGLWTRSGRRGVPNLPGERPCHSSAAKPARDRARSTARRRPRAAPGPTAHSRDRGRRPRQPRTRTARPSRGCRTAAPSWCSTPPAHAGPARRPRRPRPRPRAVRIDHRHLRAARAQAQATDRPKIPAPWMTMCIATPARLDEGRAETSANPT
jgi:hypothetical protein